MNSYYSEDLASSLLRAYATHPGAAPAGGQVAPVPAPPTPPPAPAIVEPGWTVSAVRCEGDDITITLRRAGLGSRTGAAIETECQRAAHSLAIGGRAFLDGPEGVRFRHLTTQTHAAREAHRQACEALALATLEAEAKGVSVPTSPYCPVVEALDDARHRRDVAAGRLKEAEELLVEERRRVQQALLTLLQSRGRVIANDVKQAFHEAGERLAGAFGPLATRLMTYRELIASLTGQRAGSVTCRTIDAAVEQLLGSGAKQEEDNHAIRATDGGATAGL